jgi:hypothetical protein
MSTAKSVPSPKQAVVGQWNIFGEFEGDEIPIVAPVTRKNPDRPPAVPAAAPRLTAPPKIETIVPAMRKRTPAPAPVSASAQSEQDLDYALLGERFDDGVVVDLETVNPNDSIETMLAKRMFLRMIWDLKPRPAPAPTHDLFGQASTSNQGEQDRLDALVWMYSLNPDEPLVPFEWVCDVLDFDPHLVRRITGRSMRTELKQLVNLLSTIVGADHARLCEETLSGYVDVSAWKLN